MQKILTVLLAMGLVIALAACGDVYVTPTPRPATPTRAATLTAPPATAPPAAATPSPAPATATAAPKPSSTATIAPTQAPATPAAVESPSAAPPTSLPTPQVTVAPVPVLSPGRNLGELPDHQNLAFLFKYWNSGDRAVAPLQGTYYTYVAPPGMKFVIIFYRFSNNSKVEQETPDITTGEILTQPKGYVYKLWQPPTGTDRDSFRPSQSFPIEVAQLGFSNAGHVRLLPEQSVEGRAVFEIPIEMTPLDVSLNGIPAKIVLQ